MLAGLRSRCVMPRSCASCSAEATGSRIDDHARRRHRRLQVDLFLQAGAAQQLHHHVGLVRAVEAEVEEADDVRVAELGAGAAFAQEAIARLGRRVRRRLHHLDGDFVAEADAAGAIDVRPCRRSRAHQGSRSDRRSLAAWRQHADRQLIRERARIRPDRAGARTRGSRASPGRCSGAAGPGGCRSRRGRAPGPGCSRRR